MERNKVSVLLVSVDALKPEFVFEQERLGISLPNISKYLWRMVHLQAGESECVPYLYVSLSSKHHNGN